ncbi:hypothetical protein ACTFIW_010907 [Dictyostelium discoideum]
MNKFVLIFLILKLINLKLLLSLEIIYVNENSINSTINENCGSSIKYPCRNLQSTIRNLENGTIILMFEGIYYYNYLNFENVENHHFKNNNINNLKIKIQPIDKNNRVIIQGLQLKEPFILLESKKINIEFNSITFTNFNNIPLINSLKRNDKNLQEISFNKCFFKNIILNNSLILVENFNLNFYNTTFTNINIISSKSSDSMIYLKGGNISIKSSYILDCFSKNSLFSINFAIVNIENSNFKSTNCYKNGVLSMLDSKFSIKNTFFSNELTSSSINYISTYNYNNLIDNCIFINNNNKNGGNNGIINLIFSNFGLLNDKNNNSIIINSTQFKNNIGNSIFSNNFNSIKILNSNFTQLQQPQQPQLLNDQKSSHLYFLNNSKISIENSIFKDSFSNSSYSLISINSKLITINNNSKFITESTIGCFESNIEINRNSIIKIDKIQCSLNPLNIDKFKKCNIYYSNNKELICPITTTISTTNEINFYEKNKNIIIISSLIILFYLIHKII